LPYYTGEENKAVFDKIVKLEYKVRDESISEPIKNLLVSVLKKKAYERPIIGVLKSKLEDILKSMHNVEVKQLEKPRSILEDPKLHKAFSVQQRESSTPK
jgi:hypothetical protein